MNGELTGNVAYENGKLLYIGFFARHQMGGNTFGKNRRWWEQSAYFTYRDACQRMLSHVFITGIDTSTLIFSTHPLEKRWLTS